MCCWNNFSFVGLPFGICGINEYNLKTNTMKNLLKFLFVALLYSSCIYSQSKTVAEASNDKAIDLIMKGDNINALKQINIAIKLKPQNANYLYVRGTIYQNLNNLQLALTDYKHVLAINPKKTDAMMKCGIVCGNLNDINKACDYFKLACSYGEQDACITVSKFCN